MAETIKALKRLQKRTSELNVGYRNTVRTALGKYGKVAKDVFDRSVQRRDRLLQVRQAEESNLMRDREAFAAATSTVLSKDTLDYLRGLSNIAAPTLTSVFTGFESARADEANRFERVLDEREESIERLQRDRRDIFQEAGQADRALLAIQGRITDSQVSTAGRLFSDAGQNERLVTKEIVDADQAGIQRGFSRDERLNRERFGRQERIEGQRASDARARYNQDRSDARQGRSDARQDARTEYTQRQQNARQSQSVEASVAAAEAKRMFDINMAQAKSAEERQQIKLRHEATLAEIGAREGGKGSDKSKQKAHDWISAISPNKTINPAASSQAGNGSVLASAPADMQSIIIEEAEKNGLDPELVARAIKAESNFNPRATGPETRFGKALGAMQILPSTANEVAQQIGLDNYDPFNMRQNITVGTKYLADQIKKFGSVEIGLAAYNAGPGAVARAGGVPNFDETKGYIGKILDGYEVPNPPEKAAPARTESAVKKQAEEQVSAPAAKTPAPEVEQTTEIPPPAEPVTSAPVAIEPTAQSEEEIQQLQQTVAEFQDSEDVVESLRAATQEQLTQNEALQEQVAALSENPTLDEMQAIFAQEGAEDDERARQLLAAAYYQQSLLAGGVS